MVGSYGLRGGHEYAFWKYEHTLMTRMDIKVLSYNCRGLRTGQSVGDRACCIVVDNLLNNCDILCLQETFLTKQDLEIEFS